MLRQGFQHGLRGHGEIIVVVAVPVDRPRHHAAEVRIRLQRLDGAAVEQARQAIQGIADVGIRRETRTGRAAARRHAKAHLVRTQACEGIAAIIESFDQHARRGHQLVGRTGLDGTGSVWRVDIAIVVILRVQHRQLAAQGVDDGNVGAPDAAITRVAPFHIHPFRRHRQVKAAADLGFQVFHGDRQVGLDGCALRHAVFQVQVDAIEAILGDDGVQAVGEIRRFGRVADGNGAVLSAQRQDDFLAFRTLGGHVGDELRFRACARIDGQTDIAAARVVAEGDDDHVPVIADLADRIRGAAGVGEVVPVTDQRVFRQARGGGRRCWSRCRGGSRRRCWGRRRRRCRSWCRSWRRSGCRCRRAAVAHRRPGLAAAGAAAAGRRVISLRPPVGRVIDVVVAGLAAAVVGRAAVPRCVAGDRLGRGGQQLASAAAGSVAAAATAGGQRSPEEGKDEGIHDCPVHCVSLCIFLAGRLDTVRFFRVQALQVVVNWFCPLRKITIPVAVFPHMKGDAGHTSGCFPVCWYGAGSRAGKGGGYQARSCGGYGAVSSRNSACGTRDRSSSICVKATVWRCISR